MDQTNMNRRRLFAGAAGVGLAGAAVLASAGPAASETLLAAINANLDPVAYRACIAANGSTYAYTSLPSSLAPAGNVQAVSSNQAQPYWLAIS